MTALLRALLMAVLLPTGVLLVLLAPVNLGDQIRAPATLVALLVAGVVADLISLMLVTDARSGARHVLHMAVVGVIFACCAVALAALGRAGGMDLDSTDRILLGLAATGLVGSLVASAVAPPNPAISLPRSSEPPKSSEQPGSPPRKRGLPQAVSKMLAPQEQVYCWARQTRWKHPIAPESLYATSERLLHYRPTILPWNSSSTSCPYADIARLTTHRGLLFSTLRVGSAVVKQDDFDVSDLPGKACEDLERQAMREIAQSKLTEASQPAALRAD